MGTFEHFFQVIERGRVELRRRHFANRHIAAKHAAAFVHVGHFRAGIRRTVECAVVGGFVGDGNFEARAEVLHLLLVQLLLLVSGVAAFEIGDAVTFNRLSENDTWTAFVIGRGFEGIIDLMRVVAAAAEASDFFIGHILH